MIICIPWLPARCLQASTGDHANLCHALPCLMLHFPKLWLEASGALFFGIFPGVPALRLRSIWRSIWGGVLVHVCIAVTMDLAAFIKRGLLW